jgi:hypothetical protein
MSQLGGSRRGLDATTVEDKRVAAEVEARTSTEGGSPGEQLPKSSASSMRADITFRMAGTRSQRHAHLHVEMGNYSPKHLCQKGKGADRKWCTHSPAMLDLPDYILAPDLSDIRCSGSKRLIVFVGSRSS